MQTVTHKQVRSDVTGIAFMLEIILFTVLAFLVIYYALPLFQDITGATHATIANEELDRSNISNN